MASKVQSTLVLLLLVFASIHVVSGFRMQKKNNEDVKDHIAELGDGFDSGKLQALNNDIAAVSKAGTVILTTSEVPALANSAACCEGGNNACGELNVDLAAYGSIASGNQIYLHHSWYGTFEVWCDNVRMLHSIRSGSDPGQGGETIDMPAGCTGATDVTLKCGGSCGGCAFANSQLIIAAPGPVCPAHVVANTKGDCLDAEHLDVPAPGCCKECVAAVQDAQVEYRKTITAYMTICKLTPEDADMESGTFLNPDKVCTQECQTMDMGDALVEIEYDELKLVCAAMPQRVDPLKPISVLLENFQAAWMKCRAPPATTTTTTTTTPTTSTTSTTTTAMRFNQVQIIGNANWGLLKSGNKNEQSVSAVSAGLALSELTGWRSKTTGVQHVVNVEHAAFGGTAITLKIQGEMLYGGSYQGPGMNQGAGQFVKDAKIKVTQSGADPLHYVFANVKAVNPGTHGSVTDPMASVSLICEIESGANLAWWPVHKWNKKMQFDFYGNGNIGVYFV